MFCNECDSSFEKLVELKKHMRNCHTNVTNKVTKNLNICDKCGKEFKNLASYKFHHKTVHTTDPHDFVCEICSYKAPKLWTLKKHMSIHLPPTLPCDKCGKMFKNKVYLTLHQKTVHVENKDKIFQCEQCKKGFVNKSTYEGHLNMHLGVKPFECEFCERKFQNISNKMNHVKKIHQEAHNKLRE